MLYGLLWLIVYDFTFAAGYVGLLPALLLLVFLPLAIPVVGGLGLPRGAARRAPRATTARHARGAEKHSPVAH